MMPAGAPRTRSFSPDEMIALGEEMLDWLKKHPKTLHLSEWYTIEKGFIYKQWKAFIQLPEFLPYYERAIKIVGRQYLDKNSPVRDGISQRWQRIYFADLKEAEDADAEEEAKRKASALKSEAKAIEEEKQKILDEIQRNRKVPQ